MLQKGAACWVGRCCCCCKLLLPPVMQQQQPQKLLRVGVPKGTMLRVGSGSQAVAAAATAAAEAAAAEDATCYMLPCYGSWSGPKRAICDGVVSGSFGRWSCFRSSSGETDSLHRASICKIGRREGVGPRGTSVDGRVVCTLTYRYRSSRVKTSTQKLTQKLGHLTKARAFACWSNLPIPYIFHVPVRK